MHLLPKAANILARVLAPIPHKRLETLNSRCGRVIFEWEKRA